MKPHYVKHTVEPDELILAWQPHVEETARSFLVGRLVRQGNTARLVYLDEHTEAQQHGFKGFPGLTLGRVEHEDVLPLFMRRVTSRKRGDFMRYIHSFGLESAEGLSDFALLGYSGARLVGDSFEVIHPFDGAEPPVDLWVPVAGYRHYKDKVPYESLEIGAPVRIVREPGNTHDTEAIRCEHAGRCFGYVPRGQTGAFHRWFDEGHEIRAIIEKRNGNAERPFIFLYVEVFAKVPASAAS